MQQRQALRLPSDPEYLHEGPSVRLLLRGVWTDFFPISTLAAALGRSTCQVRRLEAAGVIPAPEARYPGRNICGRPRLYQRHEVFAIVEWFQQERLVGRRPQSWRDRLASPA